MTRDRFDLAIQHCVDLGVEVEWADLGDYRRGEYRVQGNRVILNRTLTMRQATGTLGHELGHQRFGDAHSSKANERRAWQYGAALLIEPEDYRTAEQRVGCHPAAIALELDVTPRLIDAWREWWLVRGQFLPNNRQFTDHGS